MARKRDIKGVEAVGSKSMGTKRAAADGQVRSLRKRQKKQKTPDDFKSQPEQDQTKDLVQDQVFRFMDLPGELRNRVYEHALEYSHRCFPPFFPKPNSKPRRGRSESLYPPASSPLSPLPYIGLTQTCSLLRSEFRPPWLSTHKVPLSALDDYLRIYYPPFDPYASPEARRRLETQYSPSGSLRIWIRSSELVDTDVFKLLKYATRFPDFTFSVLSMPDVSDAMRASIQALIANKTPRWVQGVQGNKISQVRLQIKGNGMDGPTIRVVVRERYTLPWMKPMVWSQRTTADGYVETLGLGDVVKSWAVVFAVDYS